ncbi:MAG: hypothetical protein EA361_07755 [Bacteroidetes bacterium]|nr:MAG: hypothetical protein EA361_07755 [Bacteroidota bacterium]
MSKTIVESKPEIAKATHSGFTNWVIHHDDNLWFNIFYIGLAVVLSIWLGLFWLVAVVAVHGVFEMYRQLLLGHSTGNAFLETLWEIKLDIGLIIFAFWLGIYLDFIFGIVGLSAGARVAANVGGRAAQTGARAAVWQRFIRGFFITIDDMGLALKALGRRRSKKEKTREVQEIIIQTPRDEVAKEQGSSWRKKYSTGDWLALMFCGIFLLLILLAPLLTEKSAMEVLKIIAEDMKPFP